MHWRHWLWRKAFRSGSPLFSACCWRGGCSMRCFSCFLAPQTPSAPFGWRSAGEIRFCINAMLILKYGLIPFFLLNCLFGLLVCLAFFVGTRGTILFAFPVTVPFLLLAVFSVWATLLPGSFYGLQVVRLGIRQGKLAFPAAIFHLLLQFTFIADVFDAMYLSTKNGGWEKERSSSLHGFPFGRGGCRAGRPASPVNEEERFGFRRAILPTALRLL